jgi:hypothetical protein
MNYKFKIGQKVKVIKSGAGIGYRDTGKICTITGFGIYEGHSFNKPGYTIKEKIGNARTGDYDGMIAEETFELVKPTTWRGVF